MTSSKSIKNGLKIGLHSVTWIKGSLFLSIFLAITSTFGDSLVQDTEIVFNLFILIEFIFYVVVYLIMIHLFSCIIDKTSKQQTRKNFVSKRRFIAILGVLIIAHLPHLIVKYPAGNCLDTMYQIQQGLGDIPLNTHHPLLHTLLMTFFVKAGMHFGSANIGIFAFVLCETLTMDLVFCYLIHIIEKYNVHRFLVYSGLAFYCLSPYIVGYVGQTIKDVYYNVFVLLFLVELFELSVNFQETLRSLRWIVILVVSCIGVVMFRKDGYVLVLPSILAVVFLLIRQYAIDKKKNRTSNAKTGRVVLVIGIACALVLPLLFNEVLTLTYNPVKGSVKEALSFPLQQTARTVKYYSAEIDGDDREAIDKIVSFDTIGTAYNPVLSDPVKATGTGNFTTEDLINYLLVWGKLVTKYPTVCIRAVAAQNIYLVYSNYNMHSYYVDASAHRLDSEGNPLIFSSSSVIRDVQTDYLAYLENLHALPILKDINNAANYVVLFLFSLLICLNRKNKLGLIMYIPLILSIMVIMLGPGIRDHVRYLFPIIWSTPLWISQLFVNKDN